MVARQIGPMVVIVGETASGKSALALEVARKFNGEIISADSWQVYRGFDIGTAKPTAEEQVAVGHHVIDIVDAPEGFSAAVFKRLATKAIEDILARGKLPILAGGTGLYIDSVVYDYGFLPRPSAALRAELNALTIPELIERAKRGGYDVDGIDTRNKRRIIRLIENQGALPTRANMRQNTVLLGIAVPRDTLRERVEARVDYMLEQGLANEVKYLADTYGWDVEPMKGVGYREFKEYFEGSQNIEQTRERIVVNTMALAKKQRTWFKRNKSIHWISAPVNLHGVDEFITTVLNN
jgi:tRNA dimethylallyltransferase